MMEEQKSSIETALDYMPLIGKVINKVITLLKGFLKESNLQNKLSEELNALFQEYTEKGLYNYIEDIAEDNLIDDIIAIYINSPIHDLTDYIRFKLLSYKYDNVKVVIIGQDPYHQPNQAHGLSFSVEGNVPFPPSLRNIFKELNDDCGVAVPKSGNLLKWAQQGVLLLNTVLTVEKDKPNSHKDIGWQRITNKIIELLNNREKPIVFLLWGSSARSFERIIDKSKHYILSCCHPSPMSANNGDWFGNKCFSKTNEILKNLNIIPIDWSL